MKESLESLIERARGVRMNSQDAELQRQSFAYGNANIENSVVTKEIIRQAAQELLAGKIQVVQTGLSLGMKRI